VIVTQCILDSPLYPSSSPSLRTISTSFILLFSYTNTKYIHYIHSHSPFSYAFPSPTGTHPWKRPGCTSAGGVHLGFPGHLHSQEGWHFMAP
jgi:hypothetical protein